MSHAYCQGEQAKQLLRWISWADNDYIAARQLLLTDMLVQGSCLSNTSIEKYLKSLFMLLGLKNPRGHNVCKLYDEIKENGLKREINEEYLELLFKSYRLRYPDDLKPGFNIALNRTQMLVELDHTVYEIRKCFRITNKKGNSKIESLQEKKNPVLLNKNCYFGNYDRAALFKEESSCYELRIYNQDVYEIYYFTEEIKDDGKFDKEGFKPTSPES